MIPIVGVSLEEALLGFGGDGDAELHDKEVELSTSDITGSQTAIFEYDPADEDPQGDPPGPWDGYSLFTIDLSGVKDDIEAMQQQIADLEDELEEMQECCDEVVDVIHDYDPTYDPHPDPPDPTNPTIPEKIQEIIDEESGYTFPEGTEPTDTDWFPLIGANPITDETLDVSVFVCCYDGTNYINITKQQNPDTYGFRPAIGWNYDNNTYHLGFGDIGLNIAGDYGEIVGYTVSANGSVVLHLHTHIFGWGYDDQGQYTLDWHDKYFDTIPSQAQQELAGYGDPTHTYRAKNVNS